MNGKILITGGSGLLGSYLIRWLNLNGYSDITATYQNTPDAIPADILHQAHWIKLSLPDKAAALEIIKGHDTVIHAAGLISYHNRDKYRLLDINQTGTEHIVNACLAHGVSHLVYVGSIAALGRETDHVILNEKSVWLDNEFSTGYGLSKYLGELEVWRGGAEGLNVSVVLPSVILGAGDWRSSSLQIIHRIVHKSAWYPAGQTGFVDVRDIAFFIGKLLEKGQPGGRWLLSGADLTYARLYKELAGLLGLKKNFSLAPKWLATAILAGGNLIKGEGLGNELINQAYGTFSYDASRSLTLDGFRYRDIEVTLREISEAYKRDSKEAILTF
jgi:nucleoside-diphosphate-sugar epimerase